MDSQIKINVADVALADAAFSATVKTGVADRIQNAANTLREVSRRLESKVAMKNSASLTAAWNDIGIKAASATSLASTAKTKAEFKAANDNLVASYNAAVSILAAVK